RGGVLAAKKADKTPELAVAWSAVLPDRIDGLKAEGDKIAVLTHARTLTEVQPGGKLGAPRQLDDAAYDKAVKELQTPSDPQREALQKKLGPQRLVKLVSKNGNRTAIAFWGARCKSSMTKAASRRRTVCRRMSRR